MNVLFVCQCEKRALTETRRILDQFAERRGERTWQTAITQDGLDTVRKLLRQTARKNTAVACHWIRSADHSELLWIVGNAKQFNEQGAVPTNTTQRNILRSEDENDWHSGQDIHLLTVLSALLHDLGKACVAFQNRLNGTLTERNQYRHEWISLRLFQAFVGQHNDATWLVRLSNPSTEDDATWLSRLQRDGLEATTNKPFAALSHAPLAQAIAWLVVTHHRLPQEPKASDGSGGIDTEAGLHGVLHRVTAYWNEDSRPQQDNQSDTPKPEMKQPDAHDYWNIPESNLPVTTPLWRKRAARVAQGLLKRMAQKPGQIWLSNPYVMHLSRLCLLLADHHYSRLTVDKQGKPHAERVLGQKNFPAYANTWFDQNAQKWRKNQTLDEHLLGVAQHGGEITRALPSLERELPRLARHKGLKKPTTDERFRWQNKAADLASTMRTRAQTQGAFIVNLASTGCGKTLANARIMYALSDPSVGMRCAFAMGLRTLTLQTGKAFQALLGLGEDELAIRVGGAAHRALFEHQAQQAEKTGSASFQDLLDEDSHVFFEGNPDAHPLLQRVLHDPHAKALITAPLLVSTIDHLTPATESTRGGHQIAPMLRLMTSDLVLDEPDDFDMADLPALTRLVHWAGLLGSRVLLSSATLPPDLVQGLFEAYRHGRMQYERNRGETTVRMPAICCAWVDEFDATHANCVDAQSFEKHHLAFVSDRIKTLQKAPARRLALLAQLNLKGHSHDELPLHFAKRVAEIATNLHEHHHSTDPITGQRVSFGLVRMANIEPLVQVALALYRHAWPENLRIHLCTYHSQYPLLLRSRIEEQLDTTLNRKNPAAVFDLPTIRQRLDAAPEAQHLFIVLGSPVTEVGRDHDYDWAIVEPSSMRSLIQLAGRVRRHRPLQPGQTLAAPNIRVFQTNLKYFRQNGDDQKPCYLKPGFESHGFKLTSHNLVNLLKPLINVKGEFNIDAIPRLQADDTLQPKARLIDLEHSRMRDAMRPREPSDKNAPLNAATCWHADPQDASLTATLPRLQPFRFDKNDTRHDVDLRLIPNEDGDDFILQRTNTKAAKGKPDVWATVNEQLKSFAPDQVQGERISPWGETDYRQALAKLSEQMDMPPERCAEKFGTLTLKESPQDAGKGWRFHPALGFTKA